MDDDAPAYEFREIGESNELKLQAAKILVTAFGERGSSWPDMKSAMKEVEECADLPNLCVGLCEGDRLRGWVGLRPMYEKTWELHPLVVAPDAQGKGVGRLLMAEIERESKGRGLIGIALGTDDEHLRTSLSQVDIDESNIFDEIRGIRNLACHPYEFYKKCGYMIVGMIPNANGKRKPDIWMWKGIE
jgi:aminoglycoside 6'-N-acetyltransferase I